MFHCYNNEADVDTLVKALLANPRCFLRTLIVSSYSTEPAPLVPPCRRKA